MGVQNTPGFFDELIADIFPNRQCPFEARWNAAAPACQNKSGCPRTRKMRKPCPHKKVVSLHCEKTNPRIKRGHNQDLVTIDDLVLL